MSAMQTEVFEAFRAIDVPEEKALRAATALTSALSKVKDETATHFSRRDADLDAIRKDIASIKLDVVGIRGELMLHRWMLGFVLETNVAVLFKLFAH